MKNENHFNSNNEARQILFHGGLMTFLSLISGFTVLFALAPRIALSSHTVGLIQGAVLIGIAGAWHLLSATPTFLKVIKYTLLVGFYVNWISLQLAGLWSAGNSDFPIYSKDMPDVASAWQNLTVTVMANLSGLLVLVSFALIIWVAYRKNNK